MAGGNVAQQLLVELARLDQPHRHVQAGGTDALEDVEPRDLPGGALRVDEQLDPPAADDSAQLLDRPEVDGRRGGGRPEAGPDGDPADEVVAANLGRGDLPAEPLRDLRVADHRDPNLDAPFEVALDPVPEGRDQESRGRRGDQGAAQRARPQRRGGHPCEEDA